MRCWIGGTGSGSPALQTAHWNAAKTSATCSGIIRFPGSFSSSCGDRFVTAEYLMHPGMEPMPGQACSPRGFSPRLECAKLWHWAHHECGLKPRDYILDC